MVNNNMILGYTTRRHLLIDLDGHTINGARYVTRYVMQLNPRVGGCLICKTRRGYHLIFDNHIGWNSCVKIIERLAKEGWLDSDYLQIRTFKGDMTLRISEKWEKRAYSQPPKPVTIIENPYSERRDYMIYEYVEVLRIGIKLSWNYAVANNDLPAANLKEH